jgi:DNA-binding transcriptional LysR family regulator
VNSVIGRRGFQPDPRRLASFRFVVCGSPDYLARRGRPEHPSDLVRHNCLIYYDAPFGKHGREWPFSGPNGDLTARVSGSLETNSDDQNGQSGGRRL